MTIPMINFLGQLPAYILDKFSQTFFIVFMFLSMPGISAQNDCSAITYTLTNYQPCCYRLNVDNSSECYPQIHLVIDVGSYSSFTANTGGGWSAQLINSTELSLTHNSGKIPIGKSSPGTFCLAPGFDPLLSIQWDNTCAMVSCVADFPLKGCPIPSDACITGIKYRECNSSPYINQIVIPGYKVDLLDANGNKISSTVTDSSGKYEFCDLPPGQYFVREIIQSGWTPKVPASGQYNVQLKESEILIRNFGNCPPCSCDSIKFNVVQTQGMSEECCYALTIVNKEGFCYPYINIHLNSGSFSSWNIVSSGPLPWTVTSVTNQYIQLHPPSGQLIPQGTIMPLQFCINGATLHDIEVSTFWNNGMQDFNCPKQFQFECQKPKPANCGEMIVTYSTENPVGQVAEIFDSRPNSLAPPGNDWTISTGLNGLEPPDWTRGKIGCVFGIELDHQTGDIFLASSDVYNYDFLLHNSTNAIPCVPGSLGTGSADIFKTNINNAATAGSTVRLVSTVLSASLPFYNSGNNIPNSGVGSGNSLGNIAFYETSNGQKLIYATNLEDGRIYRIDAVTGSLISAFDPYGIDNGIAGMTSPSEERVWGIKVNNNRIYFAREATSLTTPSTKQIWSIGINPTTGEFLSTTCSVPGLFCGGESVELNTIPGPAEKITDIEFSFDGRMLLAERGSPHAAGVLEYKYIIGFGWISTSVPHYVGYANAGQNSAGGVDYGYREVGGNPLAKCDDIVWASGNCLHASAISPTANCDIYGVAGISANGNSVPANASTDLFIDYNHQYGLSTSPRKWQVGDVEVFECGCLGQASVCDSIDVTSMPFNSYMQDTCCFKLTVNNSKPNFFTGIQLCALNGVSISSISALNGWCVGPYSATMVTMYAPGCFPTNIPTLTQDFIKFCLSNYQVVASQEIIVKYLGPNHEEVCRDTLKYNCSQKPACIKVTDTVRCGPAGSGTYIMDFCIMSNPFIGFNVGTIVLNPPAGVVFTPNTFTGLNIPPGGMQCSFTTTLSGNVTDGQTICYTVTAHKLLTPNDPLVECCTDTVMQACVTLPDCVCSKTSATAMSVSVPGDTCCWKINLINNYSNNYFTGVQVNSLTPGVVFGSVGNGFPTWITTPAPPYSTKFTHFSPTSFIGASALLPIICLSGITSSAQQPQLLEIVWLDAMGHAVCRDTLELNCEPPVISDCVNLVCPLIECDALPGVYNFSFQIQNNAGFTIDQITINNVVPASTISPLVFNVSPSLSGIPAGQISSQTFNTQITGALPGTQVCFYLTVHDLGTNNTSLFCCTNSMQFCFTIPICDSLCQNNLVKNGTFQAGNNNINSSLPYFAAGGPTAIGRYSVLQSNQVPIANSQWLCVDHTSNTATGQMLIVDGSSGLSGDVAWKQQIAVSQYVTYSYSFWVNNLVRHPKDYDDPIVEMWIDNVKQHTITLAELPDQWFNVSGMWPSNQTALVDFEIRLGSGTAVGNDFAIDDICITAKDTCCDCGPWELLYAVGRQLLHPVFCGDTLKLDVDNSPFQFHPSFSCSGLHCDSALVEWSIVGPPGFRPTSSNGPQPVGNLNLPTLTNFFTLPGYYCVNMIGYCNGKKCPCKIVFYKESNGCCESKEKFCNNIMNNVALSIDHANCKAILNIGNLAECDSISQINWGQGPIDNNSYGSNSMIMHNYNVSGVYVISYLATEWDNSVVPSKLCFEKLFRDTIRLFCQNPPDSCECRMFTGTEFQNTNWTQVDQPANCGSTIVLPCLEQITPQVFIFHGDLNCSKNDCINDSVKWIIQQMSGSIPITVATGSTVAPPIDPLSSHFDLNLNVSWFTGGVPYMITVTGMCGTKVCSCKVSFMFENCPPSGCPDNLVLNPSFELYSLCPTGISQISNATPWYSPNGGTTDYFNSCSTWPTSVPNNYLGMVSAHNGGDGYAGIYVFSTTPEWREYIQVPLNSPLVAGMNYNLKFYVSLADNSNHAIQSLGAYFSTGPVSQGSYNNLPYIPQIVNSAGFLTLKNGWTLVTGSFIASGGEDYITIGNFNDDANTATTWLGLGRKTSYYYIDDICLEKVNCECKGFENLQFYNTDWTPNTKNVNCNDNLMLPCLKKGGSNLFFFHGDLCCSDSSCNNDTISWSIGENGIKIASGQAFISIKPNGCNHFDLNLQQAWFSPGNQYTLSVNGKCGNKNCSCKIDFTFAPCLPCQCDSSFIIDVEKGFSGTGPIISCDRTFKPNALCPNDRVTWSIKKIDFSIQIATASTGNNPITLTSLDDGIYTVCMTVQRISGKDTCNHRVCRLVWVRCGIFGITTCNDDILTRNSALTEGLIVTDSSKQGSISDWVRFPNPGSGKIIIDSSGASDDGSIILVGNKTNFAGVYQIIDSKENHKWTIDMYIRNLTESEILLNTKLELRLQKELAKNADDLILASIPIDTSFNGWKKLIVTLDKGIREKGIRNFVICLQNDNETIYSAVAIDNIEVCQDKFGVGTNNHMKEQSFLIIPNPNTGNFIIEMQSAAPFGISYRISEPTGRTIIERPVLLGNHLQQVDASNLTSGLYFLQILQNGRVVSVNKFVKN